jgi:hypothetical protein
MSRYNGTTSAPGQEIRENRMSNVKAGNTLESRYSKQITTILKGKHINKPEDGNPESHALDRV